MSVSLAIVLLVLAAEFVNGWTDAPNAISFSACPSTCRIH